MPLEQQALGDKRVNIDEPRWDQSTYWGRAQHFFTVTNPLNLLCSNKELEHSKDVVTRYRSGEKMEGLTLEELWKCKHIYDSAYHPETGEKVVLVGRMSAQVPMNMMITGCMMAFYKTTPQVVFWQWVNQSFNAVVNYSNRSGKDPIPQSQLAFSYVLATSGALATALSLNSLTRRMPPIVGRFVPFAAVAAANCVNIPMMRMRELQEGITVMSEDDKEFGQSPTVAKYAISMVVLSRIGMASPGMMIPPIFMNALEKKGFFARYPWANAPMSVSLAGLCLLFATPMCCALFPQKASVAVSSLEPELQKKIKSETDGKVQTVYYHKGL
ncbi:sideroflexin-3-like isoform X2 [Varroa jacobsoni]|nr:sideroflexin-3-like isoform X2 [Varroa destructor]XP_022669719.1 sideroflexin-3-like isoform X2 [Varroa destructor]XP_022695671.1 sideroflexin-3-like isoform X2 [Varroa jacobsoni]XP_022695672.1 sideroflexin-3-like isoform X2 [Varroa jacobsoni]